MPPETLFDMRLQAVVVGITAGGPIGYVHQPGVDAVVGTAWRYRSRARLCLIEVGSNDQMLRPCSHVADVSDCVDP